MTGIRPALAAALVAAMVAVGCAASAPPALLHATAFSSPVALPLPDTHGSVPLESAIRARRSQRDFAARALPLAVIGQLLWAGQGITDAQGHRAAPSAGALYPIELYVVTATQVMHYLPQGHRVEVRPGPDLRPDLRAAALDQAAVAAAPVVLVVAAVPSRTEAKYGGRADAFVDREAGHVAQNILLEATALGLAAVPVGGFTGPEVAGVLGLGPDEDVRYLVPVGYPAGQ